MKSYSFYEKIKGKLSLETVGCCIRKQKAFLEKKSMEGW